MRFAALSVWTSESSALDLAFSPSVLKSFYPMSVLVMFHGKRMQLMGRKIQGGIRDSRCRASLWDLLGGLWRKLS